MDCVRLVNSQMHEPKTDGIFGESVARLGEVRRVLFRAIGQERRE